MMHRTGIAAKSRSSKVSGVRLPPECAGEGTGLGRCVSRDVSDTGDPQDSVSFAEAVPASSPDWLFHLSALGADGFETSDGAGRFAVNSLERKHRDQTGPESGVERGGEPVNRRRSRRPRHDAGDLLRCKVVWRLVCELFDGVFGPDLASSAIARRRPRCHMRQIAMYLSHVVLSVPYGTIAAAFGRDRSTVAHACAVVEDRRDDKAYDLFVERCERCVNAVFQPFGPAREE